MRKNSKKYNSDISQTHRRMVNYIWVPDKLFRSLHFPLNAGGRISVRSIHYVHYNFFLLNVQRPLQNLCLFIVEFPRSKIGAAIREYSP